MKVRLIDAFQVLAAVVTAAPPAAATSRISPDAPMLMHETRANPFPGEGDTVGDRTVSFLWSLPPEFAGQYDPLDGFEDIAPHPDKSRAFYRIRYSRDPLFPEGKTVEHSTRWAMYNEFSPLAPGRWYWQYTYGDDGKWSPSVSFVVSPDSAAFLPPSFVQLAARLGSAHPRILVDAGDLKEFRERSHGREEARWYVEYADNALKTPMKRVEDIDRSRIGSMENEMQVKAYMTQESRRIVDAEEKNCEALIRAWLLTGDRRYGEEAVGRVMTMIGWDSSETVVGDFNDGTILSLASILYDSCLDILDGDQKKTLLDAVARKGRKMYDRFNNYVEAYLFEDHIWQMTMRITMVAALATMDELPEAREWAEYCYNLWVARMPGVNADGGWHNGDSYFSVNTRTLIELPWLFSRIAGYDFFRDPWYDGSILYTMYQQPPFSKSGGNGSLHFKVGRPNANRVGYLDALARLRRDSRAADFVRRTLSREPDYLKKSLLSKPGDLCWFRLQCGLDLPEGPGLESLPPGLVLPQTGLASAVSDWDNPRRNAWWSFRSSPYGSHSHSLANQNSFNTFYAGKPLFYSSGHHIEFTDRHTMVCHRGSLAHNTVLPGGFTQKIGVEGYGWMPRHYAGDRVTYVLGDASSAYGRVESPLWLLRGKQSELDYSEELGWGDPKLKTFRRHMIDPGADGLLIIYDELEADSLIRWHYRLHGVAEPLEYSIVGPGMVRVSARNAGGVSDLYLFSFETPDCEVTDRFLIPAIDWLKTAGEERPAHSHFAAVSAPARRMSFLSVVDTRATGDMPRVPVKNPDGSITVGPYRVEALLDGKRFGFRVTDRSTGNEVRYGEDAPTVVVENAKTMILSDVLPHLEM